MRLALNKKPFIAQSLALSVAALMMTTTHAATKEQQELRGGSGNLNNTYK